MKLDKRDLKIMTILGEDPRISYSELAKKLSISKNAAKYRLDKLFAEGIIRGPHPVIHYARIGYFTSHTFLKVRNRQEKKFKEYVKKHPRVMWAVLLFGNWDYLIEFLYRTAEELEESVNEFTQFFGDDFETCKTTVTGPPIKQQPHISSLMEAEHTLPMTSIKERNEGEIIQVDEIEKKILYELSRNGRATYQELGNKTGLSLQTAKNYFQRLIKKKILLYFIPQYNYTTLGYRNYIVNLSLYKVTPEKINALDNSIKNNEAIVMALRIASIPERLLLVRVLTTEEFENFTKKIYDEHSGIVKAIEFMHTMETLKVDFFPEGLR